MTLLQYSSAAVRLPTTSPCPGREKTPASELRSKHSRLQRLLSKNSTISLRMVKFYQSKLLETLLRERRWGDDWAAEMVWVWSEKRVLSMSLWILKTMGREYNVCLSL